MSFLDGIGAVLKKATEWFPSKAQHLRIKRKALLDEIENILRQPLNMRDYGRLHRCTKQLSKIDEELANLAN